MAIKIVIITFLLLALAVAGAKTKSLPARNETASPPPPPRNDSVSPPPIPRNDTVSPLPPPRNGTASTPLPPRNATVSPPPPAAVEAPTNCSDELVVFSNCLSYISSSPNNTTTSPSRHCCHDVASAYLSGTAICFCYLVQKPGLLGFPVNSTKILSLSSWCPVTEHGTKANFSLKALCSSVHTLPPLSSITIPDRPKPRVSGPVPKARVPRISGPVNHSPPTPRVNLTQESTAASGIQGHADNQSDISNQGHADNHPDISNQGQADGEEHPAPTFQVFPAWRTFSINESAVNPAGFFPFHGAFLVMLLLALSLDCL